MWMTKACFRRKIESFTSREFLHRLNQRRNRALYVKIKYSPPKCEPMHIIPHCKKKKLGEESRGIAIYRKKISLQPTIKSLVVWIDNILNFKTHPATTGVRTNPLTTILCRNTRKQVASSGGLHHLASTLVIPSIML